MPDAINYCDKCGKIILPSAVQAGSGIVTKTDALCQECMKTLPPEELERLRPRLTPPPVRARSGAASSARNRRVRGTDGRLPPIPAGGSTLKTAVMVGMAGIGAGALGGLLLLGGNGSGRPDERGTAPERRESGDATPVVVASDSGVSRAQQQLDKIRKMVTPELTHYTDVRRMLIDLSRSYAGTSEAEGAKALLFEVDMAHAKLAEEELSAAKRAINELASSGKFDEAEQRVRGIKSRFGEGAWFESKGEQAVADALSEIAKRRSEFASKNATVVLDKARDKLRSGSLSEARELVAKRENWPAETRKRADELAAEIEEKIAAVAAAEKLEAERTAMLAEFDRLMMVRNYPAAADYAKAKSAADSKHSDILRAGADLTQRLIGKPAAMVRGAESLVGRETRLRLTRKTVFGTVKAATDGGLEVAAAFTINNQTRTKLLKLKWHNFHKEQKDEFARLGGVARVASDAPILAGYSALVANDLAAAERAVRGQNGNPLARHLHAIVRARLNKRAYKSAMERAYDLVAGHKLKDAVVACEEALKAVPDDAKAVALLAEVRSLLEATGDLQPDIASQVNDYVAKNRAALLKESSAQVQSGFPRGRLCELARLYSQGGSTVFNWRPFGPKLREAEWWYHTFDPFVEEEKAEWNALITRYRKVTCPEGMEGWFAPDFDPEGAGWKQSKSPFGQYDGAIPPEGACGNSDCFCQHKVNTLWDKEVLLLRGTFTFPPMKKGHRYRIRVNDGQHVGRGGGYAIYVNGRQLIEQTKCARSGQGGRPKGGFITREFVKEFRGGEVTIAAISFLRFNSRFMRKPSSRVPQGRISFHLEEMRIPPLDLSE